MKIRLHALSYVLAWCLVAGLPVEHFGQSRAIDSLRHALAGGGGDAVYAQNTIRLFSLLSQSVEAGRLRFYPAYFAAYVEKAIAHAENHNDDMALARLQMVYLVYLKRNQNNESVVALGLKMLQKGVFYDPEDEYSIYFFLCEVYKETRYYAKYIETIPKKYAAYRRLKLDHAGNFNEYSDIGVAYYNMGDYGQAKAYYRQAAKKAKDERSLLFLGGLYNNIGLCFRAEKNTDSARYYFNKAIRQVAATGGGAENMDEPSAYAQYFIDVIRANIAEMEADMGIYGKNILIIQKQIKGGLRYKEPHIYLGGWHNLANIHFKKNQPGQANRYLDSAYWEIKRSNNIDFLIENLRLRGKTHLLQGHLALANQAFGQERALVDSVKNANRKHLSEIAAVLYETQQKESQIAKQQAQLLKKNSDLALKSQQQAFMWMALAGLSVLALSALYTLQKMAKDKKVIQKQEKEAKAALVQRELLLKEIHHRVKNNLQVVSGILHLQAGKIDDEALKKTMVEGQNRIASIALVHEMLYQNEDVSCIGFAPYVQALSHAIADSFDNPGIAIATNDCDIDLALDDATPLGLIITELLANSFKYAFPNRTGTISMALRHRTDGHCHFTYSDNGVGLGENFDIAHSKTTGLRLVGMLAEEMNASFVIEKRRPPTFSLVFQPKRRPA